MSTIQDQQQKVICTLSNGWDENDRPNPKIIASGTIHSIDTARNLYWVKLRKAYRSLPSLVPVYGNRDIKFV